MEKSTKLIFVVALLLCVIIIVIAVFKINFLNNKVKIQQKQEEIKIDKVNVDLDGLKDKYQKEVKLIIQEYILTNENIDVDDFIAREENVKQTIDKVMDLTLTKEFKDFHLKLIIALNSIQEGYEIMKIQETVEAQDKIDYGLEELDKLLIEYL